MVTNKYRVVSSAKLTASLGHLSFYGNVVSVKHGPQDVFKTLLPHSAATVKLPHSHRANIYITSINLAGNHISRSRWPWPECEKECSHQHTLIHTTRVL